MTQPTTPANALATFIDSRATSQRERDAARRELMRLTTAATLTESHHSATSAARAGVVEALDALLHGDADAARSWLHDARDALGRVAARARVTFEESAD